MSICTPYVEQDANQLSLRSIFSSNLFMFMVYIMVFERQMPSSNRALKIPSGHSALYVLSVTSALLLLKFRLR